MTPKTLAGVPGSKLDPGTVSERIRARRTARRIELESQLNANFAAWSEGVLTDDQYAHNAGELRFRLTELDGGRSV